MNYKKIILLVLAFFVFSLGTSFSQGGSNYTLFGFGDIKSQSGAYYDGLGGCAIAIPNKSQINFVNPALMSYATKTRLQIGYKFNQQLVDAKNGSLAQNNGKLEGFSALFAMDTASGASLSIGILPYTSVNYLISSTQKTNAGDKTIEINSTYQGFGGITNAFVGGAFKLSNKASFGILGIAHIGSIKANVTNSFKNAIDNDLTDQKNYQLNGLGTRLGLFYKINDDISLGGFYELNGKLSVTEKDSIGSTYTSKSNIITTNYNTTFPNMFGIGASYKTGKFLLGGDLTVQNFGKIDFRKTDKSEYRDAYNASICMSRLGSQAVGANYADQMAYNFGLTYRNLYYKINNQAINEFSGSFGISAPIPQSAMLDISVTGGMRGTSNNDVLREYFLRFSFTLNVGEIWFKPFYEDN